MTDKNSVLIVDSHPVFREGIKAVLSRDSRFKVIGETGKGSDALNMAARLKPGLILMEISLPDISGIELARIFRDTYPDIRILIISMYSKLEYIEKVFEAGAAGYLSKESAADRLMEGILCIYRNEYYIDSAISHHFVSRMIKHGTHQKIAGTKNGDCVLTRREQEVITLLAQGLSNKQIAEMLLITSKTVENHRSNIMGKLNFHSIHDLIRYAAKAGIIDPENWKKE